MDILISLILPGWGIIVGGLALFKNEEKRGLTMILLGLLGFLLAVLVTLGIIPPGVWRSLGS